MRVRLFCLGEPSGEILWLDSFPVTLSEDAERRVCTNPGESGHSLCRLEEQHGNLVFVCSDPDLEVRVNADPVVQGGLAPGDVLTVGDRRFLVSYERTTSHPLPRRKYRMPTAAPV